MRFCSYVQYEKGWMEWTDEAVAYCSKYRPALFWLLRGDAWPMILRNWRTFMEARIEMIRRGEEGA
jgi:hypothetical protein